LQLYLEEFVAKGTGKGRDMYGGGGGKCRHNFRLRTGGGGGLGKKPKKKKNKKSGGIFWGDQSGKTRSKGEDDLLKISQTLIFLGEQQIWRKKSVRTRVPQTKDEARKIDS